MHCKSKVKPAIVVLIPFLVFGLSLKAQNRVSSGQPPASVSFLDSTKEQDGLVGSVRRVKTECAKLYAESERVTEGPRQLLEITEYNLAGKRVDSVSYPVVSSAAGKEDYKYDDKGNIAEMTLRDARGSILSRERYKYEFDSFGNWTRMVTSLVVFEGGVLREEEVEVTYRTFTYYYDDKIAKIVGSPNSTTSATPSTTMADASRNRDSANATESVEAGRDKPLQVSSESLGNVAAHTPAEERKGETEATSKAVGSEVSDRNASPKETITPASPGVLAAAKTTEGTLAGSASANLIGAGDSNDRKTAVEYYNTGRERFEAGDLKAAIKAYQQSVKLNPESAEVYLNLGLAYLKLTKRSDAIKALKQATRLNPELAEAHYGLGLNFFEIRRPKDAAEAFKKATVLSPRMAKAHYGLALAYQELGQPGRVIEEYRILETLDRGLAKSLSQTFPQFDLPCSRSRDCN